MFVSHDMCPTTRVNHRLDQQTNQRLSSLGGYQEKKRHRKLKYMTNNIRSFLLSYNMYCIRNSRLRTTATTVNDSFSTITGPSDEFLKERIDILDKTKECFKWLQKRVTTVKFGKGSK